jgi:hypothetical protein
VKICPLSAKLLHADGHAEANSRSSQFCELAYKVLCYSASLSDRLQPSAYSTHSTPEAENLSHSDGAQVFFIVAVKFEDVGVRDLQVK